MRNIDAAARPATPVDDAGLWCEIDCTTAQNRAALFLDGVLVVDTHYLGRPEDMRMMEGAASAIARCNALDIPVVLVTNQAGIARVATIVGMDFARCRRRGRLSSAAAGARPTPCLLVLTTAKGEKSRCASSTILGANLIRQ